MSTELRELYRALAADVLDSDLVPPDAVRRHADRQTRTRMAVTAAAAGVLVAGTAIAVPAVLTGHDSSPPPLVGTPTAPATGRPSPTPTPTPTGTPSTTTPSPGRSSAAPTAPAVPDVPPASKSIPDRAFFALPANTKKEEPRFTRSDSMLPELCAASYPADRSLLARRTRLLIYKLPSSPAEPWYVPDGTFYHTITSYPNGVAATWMAEMRAAVRDCPTQTIDGSTYRQRPISGTRYGDDSLLVEISNPDPPGYGTPKSDVISLVSVVRVGNVVTVLYAQGWEGTSAEPDIVDDYTRRAVAAIRAWLG